MKWDKLNKYSPSQAYTFKKKYGKKKKSHKVFKNLKKSWDFFWDFQDFFFWKIKIYFKFFLFFNKNI
jgi:hypothetical protein